MCGDDGHDYDDEYVLLTVDVGGSHELLVLFIWIMRLVNVDKSCCLLLCLLSLACELI